MYFPTVVYHYWFYLIRKGYKASMILHWSVLNGSLKYWNIFILIVLCCRSSFLKTAVTRSECTKFFVSNYKLWPNFITNKHWNVATKYVHLLRSMFMLGVTFALDIFELWNVRSHFWLNWWGTIIDTAYNVMITKIWSRLQFFIFTLKQSSTCNGMCHQKRKKERES